MPGEEGRKESEQERREDSETGTRDTAGVVQGEGGLRGRGDRDTGV